MGLYRKCSICNGKVRYGTKCKCEEERARERYRVYKQKRNDKEEQKFYGSKEWSRLRKTIDIRYHGMCLYCLLMFDKIVDREANHHIIEIKDDWSRRLDDSNIIPLCDKCHKNIHYEYKINIKNKRNMQEKLFNLLKKYEKEFM